MKKLLFLFLAVTLFSCNAEKDYYDEEKAKILIQIKAEQKFQALKLSCVNEEMARNTNLYGMGKTNEELETRGTTDAPRKAPMSLINKALESFKSGKPLTEITPEGDKFITTIQKAANSNNYFYLTCLGASNIGRQVNVTSDSYHDVIRTVDNKHENAKFVTNGEYDFIITSDGENGFVYLMSDYRMDGYFICIEDLGGSSLDYNDVVIYGAKNMKPVVIWRGGDYEITLEHEGKTKKLDGFTYGKQNIELPFNNMNTPNSWNGVKISCKNEKGIVITIDTELKNANHQPNSIGTSIDYKFHKDENTMTSEEFESIPFYM